MATKKYSDNKTLQEQLRAYVKDGLITERKHPNFDLFIYNYTPKVQFRRLWDELTIMSRGLILDASGNIVGRPFPKFFNMEELNQEMIPFELPTNEQYEVFEKMDGSLGIVYMAPDGKWHVATRGSFESPQALKAQQLLKNYNINEFVEGFTYLFEIIYPENRIVVDYGDQERLVLLDVISNETGTSYGVDGWERLGFDVVNSYKNIESLSSIRDKFSGENKEGFVVKFESGFRIKLKFEEYVQLHKIISQMTPLHIWEILSSGGEVEDLVGTVPDELYDGMQDIRLDLREKFFAIKIMCIEDYNRYLIYLASPGANPTRKGAAKFFKQCEFPSILFKMLDKKKYDDLIWKMVRPKGE